jgi:hypothetical protein
MATHGPHKLSLMYDDTFCRRILVKPYLRACARQHPLTQIGPHAHTCPLATMPARCHQPTAFFGAHLHVAAAIGLFRLRHSLTLASSTVAATASLGSAATSTPSARAATVAYTLAAHTARPPLSTSFTSAAHAGLLHIGHPPLGSPPTLATLSPNSGHRSPQPSVLTTATKPGRRTGLQSPVSSPHDPFLLCPRLC